MESTRYSNWIKIGALWVNKDKKGEEYLSGKLGDAVLVVYPSKYAGSKRRPDYLVYIVDPPDKILKGNLDENVLKKTK